jgi:hypothetical protein
MIITSSFDIIKIEIDTFAYVQKDFSGECQRVNMVHKIDFLCILLCDVSAQHRGAICS